MANSQNGITIVFFACVATTLVLQTQYNGRCLLKEKDNIYAIFNPFYFSI